MKTPETMKIEWVKGHSRYSWYAEHPLIHLAFGEDSTVITKTTYDRWQAVSVQAEVGYGMCISKHPQLLMDFVQKVFEQRISSLHEKIEKYL